MVHPEVKMLILVILNLTSTVFLLRTIHDHKKVIILLFVVRLGYAPLCLWFSAVNSSQILYKPNLACSRMPKINKFDIETSIRPIRSLRSGAVCRALSESETSRLRIERGNRNGVWHMILQTRVCGVFVFIVYLIYGFYSIKWKQYCICIRLRVCFRGRSLMFWWLRLRHHTPGPHMGHRAAPCVLGAPWFLPPLLLPPPI